MSDVVAALIRSLQALFAEERAEITQRLWRTFPNIKQELFEYYDQEFFEELEFRIDHVLQCGPARLTPTGAALCEQALALPHEDRLEVAHMIWQSLPTIYGLFGDDDPEFLAELQRRMADHESGKSQSIPHEEFMRQMREKYG